jgi:hypothetical protein
VGEQENAECGTCFFLKNHQIGWMAEWSKALVSGTSLRAERKSEKKRDGKGERKSEKKRGGVR